jgi:hypothetical protein
MSPGARFYDRAIARSRDKLVELVWPVFPPMARIKDFSCAKAMTHAVFLENQFA